MDAEGWVATSKTHGRGRVAEAPTVRFHAKLSTSFSCLLVGSVVAVCWFVWMISARAEELGDKKEHMDELDPPRLPLQHNRRCVGWAFSASCCNGFCSQQHMAELWLLRWEVVRPLLWVQVWPMCMKAAAKSDAAQNHCLTLSPVCLPRPCDVHASCCCGSYGFVFWVKSKQAGWVSHCPFCSVFVDSWCCSGHTLNGCSSVYTSFRY